MEKKNRRLKVRRLLAPTVSLTRHAVWVFLGLTIFLGGFALSFRQLLSPFLSGISTGWNQLIAAVVREESREVTNHLLGGLLLLGGAVLLYRGVVGILREVVPGGPGGSKTTVVDSFVRRQQLARGPKIVAIGGGTGLSTLLRGLKQHSSNITAVVTVTDDGGSSGRLVQEMGILPPGDLRNCLVALADVEKRMTDLFQHRFTDASGSLSGHSIGNLLIAALVEQAGGDVDQALKIASEVLAIRGRVVPSTMDRVQLRALMDDGQEICGETRIVQSGLGIRRVFLDPGFAEPHPEAIQAIREADLIVIGPGSVYTSIIPNLLVRGVAKEINQSSAIKVYICNVMTQHGESDAFTAAEHMVALQANVEHRVADFVLVNIGVPSQAALDKYKEFDQTFVEPDLDRIRAMGLRVVTGNLISETDYVRHDPARLAQRIMDILYR